MIRLTVDDSRIISKFIKKEELKTSEQKLNNIVKNLNTLPGNEYQGWINWPSSMKAVDIYDIEVEVQKLVNKSDYIVLTGIGGSYLGARAVIEALSPYFFEDNSHPQILYAGNHLSEDYHADLLKTLANVDFSVIVISKSGKTTEPAIAFRLLYNELLKHYGYNDAISRIIAITDKEKGALKQFADKHKIKTFVIPNNIGGRFSVLTPVGLVPIRAAGFDIHEMLKGAIYMQEFLINTKSIYKNPAWLYASIRNILYAKGFNIEILNFYEPRLYYLGEWWKQLFGESEGKDQQGIFPATATFTTDLHSLGQFIQEGPRNLFSTVIHVESNRENIIIEKQEEDIDELNYLAGKSLGEINRKAMEGTMQAHTDGGVPNLMINIRRIDEYNLGQLLYFFEYSCALSAYLAGVNPFNQPGVEAYKKNMFKLLGKPGVK